MSRARRLASAVALVVVVASVYVAITAAQVVARSRVDQARAADAIVVLGAAQFDGRPSPVLAARLDHALALYGRGLAPVIVVTGGKQPGDRVTEAAASAAYLVARGVPDEAILREVQGRTSWESLAASARFLRARGIDDVVLVSDPYHSKRIAGIADEVGLMAVTSPTRTSPEHPTWRRWATETGGVALARFIGYRRLLRLDH